jgi:hypothetical protein
MALMAVGVAYYRQGDVHTAVPVLERGLALCQTANFPRLVPLTASFLGAAYALTGRPARSWPGRWSAWPPGAVCSSIRSCSPG